MTDVDQPRSGDGARLRQRVSSSRRQPEAAGAVTAGSRGHFVSPEVTTAQGYIVPHVGVSI